MSDNKTFFQIRINGDMHPRTFTTKKMMENWIRMQKGTKLIYDDDVIRKFKRTITSVEVF